MQSTNSLIVSVLFVSGIIHYRQSYTLKEKNIIMRSGRGYAALAILIWFTLTTGCVKYESLPINVNYPASIAYWPQRNMILVGGYQGSMVEAISMTDQSRKTLSLGEKADGRIIRLKVDGSHALLWILNTNSIQVYDLLSNKILLNSNSNKLFGNTEVLTDIALDSRGNAYIIGSDTRKIIRIQQNGFVVNAITATRVEDDAKHGQVRMSGFNALAISPDDNCLIASGLGAGSLWKISLIGGVMRPIKLSESIGNVYSLEWGNTANGITLFAVRLADKRITALRFDHDYIEARINDVVQGWIDGPAGAAYFGGKLYIAESQLHHYMDAKLGVLPIFKVYGLSM